MTCCPFLKEKKKKKKQTRGARFLDLSMPEFSYWVRCVCLAYVGMTL